MWFLAIEGAVGNDFYTLLWILESVVDGVFDYVRGLEVIESMAVRTTLLSWSERSQRRCLGTITGNYSCYLGCLRNGQRFCRMADV